MKYHVSQSCTDDLILLTIGDHLERPIAGAVLSLKTCYLFNLWVAQDKQRQGLAMMLLDAAEDAARSKGLPKIIAATHPSNLAAVGVFKKRKYKQMVQFSKDIPST